MPDDWIRQWGDPVLHEVATPVLAWDDVTRAQVSRLKRRLIDAEGAGLAGTQLGFLRRVFVWRESLEDDVEICINPEIVARSSDDASFLEGCLSDQSVAVLVARPVAVRVRAQAPDGRSLLIEAEGYRASLLQHEIDHLDGVLTLDRADLAERRRAISLLMRPENESNEGLRLAS